MKTKILSGLICCLGIFSANAQTITAPVGQALTITNSVDVTGGGLNILTDNEFKIGGKKVLSNKGNFNFFAGENSGMALTTGQYNAFIGGDAGKVNTTGSNNLFLGVSSGTANTTGSSNVFMGTSSGSANTTGSYNLFLGENAGRYNTTAINNMFMGVFAGFKNTTGGNNSFIGSSSGYENTTGTGNAFIGYYAGVSSSTGNYNVFIGDNSGRSTLTSSDNTFVGGSSGYNNSIGTRNVFLGKNAGNANIDGNDNVAIGFGTNVGGSLSNSTAIGANATASSSNTVVLGNAATTITGTGLAAGVSGLKFAKITSATAATTGGANKVLSVDVNGNVILVGLTATSGTVGTTGVGGPVAESTWKEADGYLYNNSTNGVVIKGTGLDGNSLIVKGGVLSKEVNVKIEGSEAWPDYVFKPNYKRMTLGEVEKFISINGHLPNIPSATEMAATGNNLGKTDVKLLEKVEELTLYLLDMKKANDAQAAELKALKQQVSKLRKK
jgi:trimeric autotransporter adhesin